MSRTLLITGGAMAVWLAGCTNTPTAATGRPKVYYAHDTQTGSHLPRAYTDPNDSGVAGATAADTAGARPFAYAPANGNGGGGTR